MTVTPGNELALALTQIRPILRNWRFWTALVCGGLTLGIAGPFGTVSALTILPRLAYWVFMVMLTGATGLILCRTFTRLLIRAGLPRLPAAALSGLIAGVPINLIVQGLNTVLLPPGALSISPTELTLALFAISISVSVSVSEIFFANRSRTEAPQPLPPRPRLIDRLPPDMHGPLVALSAIDHYTEVTTTAGRTSLLLRLSDAIAEAEPTPGLRIHRSHWVALDQIAATRRDGPRAIITLTDGSERPVSRGYTAAVEQAGLLPPR